MGAGKGIHKKLRSFWFSTAQSASRAIATETAPGLWTLIGARSSKENVGRIKDTELGHANFLHLTEIGTHGIGTSVIVFEFWPVSASKHMSH